MKRILYGILIFFTAFPLSACGGTGEKVSLSENSIPNSSAFDFKTKTVMLNSGYEMPIYGIGTYSLLDEVCVESVSAALDRGVRLIDTAYMYHNDVICCEV